MIIVGEYPQYIMANITPHLNYKYYTRVNTRSLYLVCSPASSMVTIMCIIGIWRLLQSNYFSPYVER